MTTTRAHVPEATTAPAVITQESIVTSPLARKVLAIARIVVGFFFLWPFLDKTFGLGFSTPAERAWINGGTPAQGYLDNLDPAQPLAGFFQSAFSNPFGDVVFMLGLLGIGVAMIAGAGLRIAAIGGTLLMAFMYLVALPWIAGGTNPVLDSHWVEAMLLLTAAVTLSGDTWGLGRWWASTDLVRRYRWLR
ncbi:DoxX family protein [Pseudactinotalea suaedae]|uniref:DoxX family protein n=1 Tax=Pseudactinotalea suaedae TaxID=1524924 RepID=UPI0012E20868|nr:DoxX family protein [Pseudactinotalea suaedae]